VTDDATDQHVGLAAAVLVAGHRVGRMLDAELTALGIGAGEAMVLRRLQDGSLTMGQVMATLDIRASTATSLVDRLVRKGLAHRSPNPSDARSLLVELTEAGQDLADRSDAAFVAVDAMLADAAGRRLDDVAAWLCDLRA
jgi:DNA-binding MarR family transcriptional regulator